jgi:probable phosphoglycerate mutase
MPEFPDLRTALSALARRPFYFLRHGETEWNKQALAQGQTDIPLNQAGRDQASDATPLLTGHGLKRIVTSPLSRAADTAAIVNGALSLPLERHAGLKERAFGPFEGKPFDRGWYDSGPGQGAEEHEPFNLRIISALAEILERWPGPVLLVSHGGVYRAFGKILCKLPAARAPNAVPFRFDPPAETGAPWTLHPVDPVRHDADEHG